MRTPEELRAYDREWRAKHPNYRREKMRQWRKDHKAIIQQETQDYYAAHREEKLIYGKRYREENKEALAEKRKPKQHGYRLATNYGISEEEYATLLAQQGGKCAACGGDNSLNRQSTRLFVDHDHVTGKIRGLLCHSCNVAAGLLKDDPERALRLAEYLTRTL